MPVAETNLATNPSFEATGASTTIWSNAATNPSFETTGTNLSVRTNLHTNPNLATATTPGWSTGGPALVRSSFGGKWWVPAAAGTYTYAAVAGAVVGKFYGVLLRVRGPVGTVVTLSGTDNVVSQWAVGNGTIPANGELILRGTASRAVAGTAISFGLTPSASTTGLFITDAYVEEVPGVGFGPTGPYFDGSMTTTNMAINPRALAATGGWNNNNGGMWDSAFIASGVPTHPQGLTTAIKGSIKEGQVGASAMSLYNLDGLTTTAVERHIGLWVYVDKPDYQITGNANFASQPLPQNVWTFVRTAVPVAGGAHAIIGISKVPGTGYATPEDHAYATGVVSEFGTETPPTSFYDALQQDFSYVWSGTANNSSSIQMGVTAAATQQYAPAHAIQSSDWAASGTKSVRVIPRATDNPVSIVYLPGTGTVGYGIQPNKTYTALIKARMLAPQSTVNGSLYGDARRLVWQGAGTLIKSDPFPNEAGVHEIRFTFTTPAETTTSWLYAVNGARFGGGDVWFDDFLIVEGTYTGPYFDGNTANTADLTYAWSGTAHASTTEVTGLSVPGVSSTTNLSKVYSSTESPTHGTRFARVLHTGGTGSLTIYPSDSSVTSATRRTGILFLRASRSGTVRVRFGGSANFYTPLSLVAGEWTELRASGSGHTGGLGIVLDTAQGWGAGDYIDLDAHLTVLGDYTGPYFDGSTQNTPTRFTAWTGTPDASTSTASTYAYLPTETGDGLNAVRRYLWFGNTQKMQWLPMPSTGMGKSNTFNTESGTYENGGGWGRRSGGSHKVYGFEFGVREASGANGLDMYTQYASGYYGSFPQSSGTRGSDLMYFADPSTFDQNVLPPHWATPALALQGDSFHHIGPFASRANTLANTYDQPPVTVTYSVTATTHSDSWTSPRRRIIIAIPPTHRFSFGWSGTRTGAAGIGYTLYNHNGTRTDVATPIGPINNGTLPARIGSLEVSGQTAYAVELYLKSDSSRGVSIVSMMGQLIPEWNLTEPTGGQGGRHIQGLGHTGCMFVDEAIVESYQMIDTYQGRSVHLKGLSTTLKEVGAWGAVG